MFKGALAKALRTYPEENLIPIVAMRAVEARPARDGVSCTVALFAPNFAHGEECIFVRLDHEGPAIADGYPSRRSHFALPSG